MRADCGLREGRAVFHRTRGKLFAARWRSPVCATTLPLERMPSVFAGSGDEAGVVVGAAVASEVEREDLVDNLVLQLR